MFPVITSITAIKLNEDTVEYRITQSLQDIGPASDTRLSGGMRWSTSLAYKVFSNTIPVIKVLAGPAQNGQTSTVGTEAVTVYNTKGGQVIGRVDTDIFNDRSDQCIAYVSYHSDSDVWDSSVIVPAGCTTIPPSIDWCKITTPQITFDHGTMALSNADNNVVTSEVGVNCTTAMAITFKLAGDAPYVTLQPSGKSEIKVNDLPLNTKIDMPLGRTELPISSTLSGITEEGVNSGSAVLIMMPF